MYVNCILKKQTKNLTECLFYGTTNRNAESWEEQDWQEDWRAVLKLWTERSLRGGGGLCSVAYDDFFCFFSVMFVMLSLLHISRASPLEF